MSDFLLNDFMIGGDIDMLALLTALVVSDSTNVPFRLVIDRSGKGDKKEMKEWARPYS